MYLRKTVLLFSLLLGLSSPLMAEVFLEDFSDPLGDWTSGWLYLNSNMENYYVATGTCDANYRGNNPSGLWISDDKGCGTLVSTSPVAIDIMNGFGDGAELFSIDICRFGSELTLNVFDKDGSLDTTTNVPGTCTQTGAGIEPALTTYEFTLGNGMSKFELVGGGIEGNTAIDNVIIDTDAVIITTARAAFTVTKDFTDNNASSVDVTLSCNTGLPLEQSFTIIDPEAGLPAIPVDNGISTTAGAGVDPSPTDHTSVTFIVTSFTEGEMDCTITESPVPVGYSVEYDDGTPSSVNCSYDDVNSGDYSCAITNAADPATFTVYKEWESFGAGGGIVNENVIVSIYCNNEIEDGDYSSMKDAWYISDELDDGGHLTATIDTTYQSAECWAEEQVFESGVESTGNCDLRTIHAGESSDCTFVNTVFFEGIPTLNQYGLAVLVLLTLGLGMVGFRRFS